MKNTTTVHVELTVKCIPPNPAHVEAVFEPVADAFADCKGLIDPDLAADTGDSTLTFSMYFEDPMDPADAMRRATAAARTALHAAGESTPGWDMGFGYSISKRVGSPRLTLA